MYCGLYTRVKWIKQDHWVRKVSKQTRNKWMLTVIQCTEMTWMATYGEVGILKRSGLMHYAHCGSDASSVQFSRSVVSDSLWPHGLQYARPPCPSPIPAVYSNSCPLSRWCHPTISSSVFPFSSRPQFFPGSGSFQMSQLFASGGQSIGASVSASVLPMNIQCWFPLGLTSCSPCCPRNS